MPWMGYFYKIAQSDTFVFYDTAEYTKKSFIRRVKIHKPNQLDQEKYIIVPLQKHSDFCNINELQLLQDDKWLKTIKSQLHHTYGKSPFYKQIEPILDTYFSKHPESNNFSVFSSSLIKYISDMLELQPNWLYSSDMHISSYSTESNIEMITKAGGTHYISGHGAKKYQTDQQYIDKDIQIKYSKFNSKFTDIDLPPHMKYKSIISYLACYDIEFVQDILRK